ncbi:MAG: PAS domain-containing protein [Desulfohalobiaceae bacterium]|nr:PAS domain-containing protein [Desulfohalobiaceae bacterium]
MLFTAQHQQTETAIEAAKQQWEKTFDAISDWVCLVDRDYRIVRTNTSGADFLRIPIREIIGRQCYDLVQCNLESFEKCPLQRALQSGLREENEIKFPDGRWWHIVIDPIDSGLAVKIVSDITQRKQAEAEKEQMQARQYEHRKSESLNRMAGAIAHHFNNQLSVIQGNLELAMSDVTADSGITQNLIQAMQAAKRSAEISRMLLNFLGWNPGGMELLDLSKVCADHLAKFKKTLPPDLSLELELREPGPLVQNNVQNLQLILFSLISNAHEALDDPKPPLTVATKTISAEDIPGQAKWFPIDWRPNQNRYACLEVTDRGCGIDPDDLDKIFDPFFTTKFTGRGLSLAAVLGLVSAADGAVLVQSRVEQGSTFQVLLPLAEKAALGTGPDADDSRGSSSAENDR